MKRFTSAEIDHLLEHPAQSRATDDLPDDFFEQMEQRILSATVEADAETPEAVAPEAKVSARPRRFHLRPLWAAAAAAVVLIVCTFAVKNMHHVDPQADDTATESYATVLDATEGYESDDDLYALSPEADDNDIEDLDEIYEADIFLNEM